MLDHKITQDTQSFLNDFGAALSAGYIAKVKDMFTADCYWRDLVSFTWNIKTLEGQDQVGDMLSAQLAHIAPSQWELDENEVQAMRMELSQLGFVLKPRSGVDTALCGSKRAKSGPF